MNLEELSQKMWDSAFNKTNYEVSQDFLYIKEDLVRWSSTTDQKASGYAVSLNKTLSFEDVLRKITPEFQRDNNKWSQSMQIKFVENLIMGTSSTIMLGSLTGQKSECVLLDGLQRVTAIFAFMNNEFKVFDELEFNPDFEQICNHIHNLKLRIYNFKNEKEMVQFYIDVNENITHSSEDIEKAKNYLRNIKG